MGLFRRRTPDPPPRPDETFPFFGVEQAQRFRLLVRSVLAERGHETTISAEHLAGADGAQYGLWNLAVACRDAGAERRWRGMVEDHVDRLLAAQALAPFDDVDPEDLDANVYVRLHPPDVLADRSVFGYATEPIPGTVEAIALDLPTAVVTFRDEDVERYGGAARLRSIGLRNLRGVLDTSGYEHIRSDDSSMHVVAGESVFVASLALVLPDVLDRVLGRRDPPYGVFACMPYRHLLAFHVVADAGALASLDRMAAFAYGTWEEEQSPLVPWVYWWRDGTWSQLSGERDGQLVVDVGPELGEVLERVTGGG